MRVLAVCSLLVFFIGLGYSFRITELLEPFNFNEGRQDDSGDGDPIVPVFAAAFLATVVNNILGSFQPVEPEWQYCYKKEECGEEAWKEQVATCNGFHQSPIDVDFTSATPVDDSTAADNGALTFSNYETVRTLAIGIDDEHYNRFTGDLTRADENKLSNKGGKTVQLDVLSGNTATLSGGPLGSDYKVLQLHFHWGSDDTKGSEHYYDGTAYPMEIHVVHYKAAYEGDLDKILGSVDGLAVTGFMFTPGAENTALKPITDALENINEANSYQKLSGFRLDNLIAPAIMAGETYATYPGGLTTPPCNEVVTWLNFKTPLTISDAQLKAFRELMDGKGGMIVNNYRSPQPTAGRVPKLFKTTSTKKRCKGKRC